MFYIMDTAKMCIFLLYFFTISTNYHYQNFEYPFLLLSYPNIFSIFIYEIFPFTIESWTNNNMFNRFNLYRDFYILVYMQSM